MPATKPRAILRRGTRADQPDATHVAEGTVYFVTDEAVLERSNGTAWEGISPGSSGPTPSWTDIPFDANDFHAAGSMTWTVAEGDIMARRYIVLEGNTMVYCLTVVNTSVGGTPSNVLNVELPAGYTIAARADGSALFQDNGTQEFGRWVANVGNSFLQFVKVGAGNWKLSSGATNVYMTATFQVTPP